MNKKEIRKHHLKIRQEMSPTNVKDNSFLINDKILNLLNQYGYKVYDADRSSAINKSTLNLLAWHQRGPLDVKFIQRVIDR